MNLGKLITLLNNRLYFSVKCEVQMAIRGCLIVLWDLVEAEPILCCIYKERPPEGWNVFIQHP